MSIIEQKPATTNQIKSKKPNIIKNNNILQGYIANSFNGGHLKPIAFAPIMAGQQVIDHKIKLNLKMLTPKTPVFQKLSATVRTFFVPNSRVWTNWEKFDAQKGGYLQEKISKIPSIGGKVPISTENENDKSTTFLVPLTDTDTYRDSWISTYIPRYQSGLLYNNLPYPEYNILQLRGFKAIYNDYLRNKEYDEPFTEYFTDEMSEQEYQETFEKMKDAKYSQFFNIRGKRNNSYYTDYRTELISFTEDAPYDTMDSKYMTELVEYEKLIAESRNQAENAQKTDWQIIAEQHGSRILTEGKVQEIGRTTFGINYNAVTQDTYNTNENITEDFQVLGEQGAYSYTEVELSLYQMTEFKESGFIHAIIQISADSIFETGFDRQLMNVNYLDQYHPELKELKDDVLYDIEKCGTGLETTDDLTKVTGYKRKFSEYFKLPNCINGDIMNRGFYITYSDTKQPQVIWKIRDNESSPIPQNILPKDTFAFFESDDKFTIKGNQKNIWQDYTDLLINKNQAIENDTFFLDTDINGKPVEIVKGPNQFIMLGIQTMISNLPIDENIKNNYQTWGEK